MRKIIKTILVITVLFIFPGACWFFLQSGLDWRKEKAKQLQPKANLLETSTWNEAETKILERDFKGKTSLIKLNMLENKHEKEIIDQFGSAYTFQWTTLDASFDSQYSKGLEALTNEFDYILLDTAMTVRQTYKGNDTDVFKLMVEDIALTIPKKKPLDIKMRKK